MNLSAQLQKTLDRATAECESLRQQRDEAQRQAALDAAARHDWKSYASGLHGGIQYLILRAARQRAACESAEAILEDMIHHLQTYKDAPMPERVTEGLIGAKDLTAKDVKAAKDSTAEAAEIAEPKPLVCRLAGLLGEFLETERHFDAEGHDDASIAVAACRARLAEVVSEFFADVRAFHSSSPSAPSAVKSAS